MLNEETLEKWRYLDAAAGAGLHGTFKHDAATLIISGYFFHYMEILKPELSQKTHKFKLRKRINPEINMRIKKSKLHKKFFTCGPHPLPF